MTRAQATRRIPRAGSRPHPPFWTVMLASIICLQLAGCALPRVARSIPATARATLETAREVPAIALERARALLARPPDERLKHLAAKDAAQNLYPQVQAAARANGLDPRPLQHLRASRITPGAPASLPPQAALLDAAEPDEADPPDAAEPDVHSLVPFEVTPEIKAFAERNTRGATTAYQQAAYLLAAIYAANETDAFYEAGRTGTAAETLASRRGNCFAYTNLFVASARALGIPAFYLDASRSSNDLRLEDGRVLHGGHIVAGVVTTLGMMTVDFYRMGKGADTFWYRRLTDLEATALFINNLGYDALRYGIDAEPYFRTAVSLAPGLEQPWNNLAVLLMNTDRAGEAERLLLEATSRRLFSFAPLYNLGLLYMRAGDYQRAERCFKRAYWHRTDNPYLFYHLALSYLHQGRNQDARRALEKAVRLDDSLAMAQTKLDRLRAR